MTFVEKKNPVTEINVRQYYDDNSNFFLRFGQNAGSAAIHQPLYFDPADNIAKAIHGQHVLIAEFLADIPTDNPGVLDLGCGVGSSMLYLRAATGQGMYTGITISKTQAEMGSAMIQQSFVSDFISIREGSYLDIPAENASIDLAYAIESVIHCSDIDRFLGEVSRVLKPGGILMVFDDFLNGETAEIPNGRERAVLDSFQQYWKAICMISDTALVKTGETHSLGYVANRDLTPYLKLNRSRDKFIKYVALPLCRLLAPAWSYTRFLKGGNARQRAYMMGLLRYAMVVLEKQ